MLCPACTTERLTIAERQGVEIDYCPKCRGVWLDRGELDKLIVIASTRDPFGKAPHEERGNFQRADQSHRRYDRDPDDDDNYDRRGYERKRRGSIWGEIFDFD